MYFDGDKNGLISKQELENVMGDLDIDVKIN